MAPLLIQQLENLGTQVRQDACRQSQDWAALATDVERLTAAAIEAFRQIESAAAARQSPDPNAWSEAAAREFIPAFENWLAYALELKALRRDCKARGHPAAGAPEFLHAIIRSKIYGPDFDSILESLRRIERGESRGRPLEEVMDELRRQDRTAGG
jgi:hypothetical protein